MCHMFSKLLDSQDLTSHLIFVKNCLTVSSCFYGQNKPKLLQNLFHAFLNNPINPVIHARHMNVINFICFIVKLWSGVIN